MELHLVHCLSIFVLIVFAILPVCSQNFLAVSGTNLTLNGEKVFLSGMNQAWYKYSRDFGRRFYSVSRPHLLKTLDAIRQSGGNSVRIWLHTTGHNTPRFNSSGYVIGLDHNFTRDLVDFVKQAQQRNILVTFTLWNCAGNREKDYPVFGLLKEESKLQSYIKRGLPKIVRAVKSLEAMAIWEIINEPEGCVIPEIRNTNEPCYDTSTIYWREGAGFSKRNISLVRILRFIALQAHVIHRIDPKALVTVGSWNHKTVTNQLGRRDFYTDKCLKKASGGRSGAKLDLYQIHTYDNWVYYQPTDPFKVDVSLYALDKPVIIGEFSQRRGGMLTSEEQFLWAYEHGYNGAWSWCARGGDVSSDDLETQKRGMHALKDKNDQSLGGRVNIKLRQKDTFLKRFLRVLNFLHLPGNIFLR